MPTANIRAKSGKAVERFPRGERGVVCHRFESGLRQPPRDRMLREDRRMTKAEFRGVAGMEPERALERLRD